ncbi:MAG: hypothetical protein GWN96_06955 [candidate division Zixibacteria bacterium]|nr:hypothetical protein [candidate division Zixibacteria bacterium]NIW40491.1 hypothetical protein [candidate division Zixibacteria bacterium]
MKVKQMRYRGFVFRIFETTLIMLLIGCLPNVLKDDHIDVGTILEKTVIGYSEGDSAVLINASSSKIKYLNDEIKGLFTVAEDNVMISEDSENELLIQYPKLKYHVKVRLCIQQSIKEYTLDRVSFNALQLGIIAKYKMNDEETAIDSLIAY